MDKEAMESLRRFSELANKTVSHPLDRARFNEFIVTSHKRAAAYGRDEISRELVSQGWEEEDAEHLADDYQNGRDLLEAYDKRR